MSTPSLKKSARTTRRRASRPTAGPASIDAAVDRVLEDGERVILRRAGKKVAAVVPIEDLEFLEEIDAHLDRRDAKEARAILEEMDRKGEKPVPFEVVRKELGL